MEVSEEDVKEHPQSPVKAPRKVYSEIGEVPKTHKQPPRLATPSTPLSEQKWFQPFDGKTEGKLNAKDLQMAFKVYQGKNYSDNVCKFVVRLFDLDKNGGIDVREFEQLFFSMKQWVNAFNSYDRSRTGYLTESELDVALKSMDVNFSPEFIAFLIMRADHINKKMSLDQFIVTCVQMQKYTNEFKAREHTDGVIKLRYEDFLELLMKSML